MPGGPPPPVGINLHRHSFLRCDGLVRCFRCLNHSYVFDSAMNIGRLVAQVADKSQQKTQSLGAGGTCAGVKPWWGNGWGSSRGRLWICGAASGTSKYIVHDGCMSSVELF